MLVEQADRHRLQRLRGRRDLGEDVDAVLVVLHHALEPADLTLDPAQPLDVSVLAGGVPAHAARVPRGGTRYFSTRRMTVIGPIASMLASLTVWPKLGACSARRLSTAMATWCTGW